MEKKKKFYLLLPIVVFFTLTLISHVEFVLANPVSFETAQIVAERWMKRVGENKNIEEGVTLHDDGNRIGYLFNFSDGGFVVVPADDIFKPIKAWSRRGFFGGKSDFGMDMETLVKRSFRRQRSFLKKTTIMTQPATSTGWEKILAEDSPRVSVQVVGPLLTTEWGQRSPYNNYCPFDDNYGEISVTGCTNTAIAQILRYWQWPKIGVGSKCYSFCSNHDCSLNPEVEVCADFEHSYNWGEMPKAISETSPQEEIDAIARLMADVGVINETTYSAIGSGAFPREDSFSAHLLYSDELEEIHEYRDNFFLTVKEQLEKRYPVFFCSDNHAYVADGYRIDLGMNQTHFNFGWDGSANGWYTLDQLNEFWDYQEGEKRVTMIINIYPGESYQPKPFYVEPTGFCGGNIPCYSTIQAAIDAASFKVRIKIVSGVYRENLKIKKLTKSLILSGGWDATFTTQLSNTDVNSLTIRTGTVRVKNIVLR